MVLLCKSITNSDLHNILVEKYHTFYVFLKNSGMIVNYGF